MCLLLRPHTKKSNELMPTMFVLQLPGKLVQVGAWQEASPVGRAGHAERRNACQGLASLFMPARREKLDLGVLIPVLSSTQSVPEDKSLEGQRRCVALWEMGTKVASSDLEQEERGCI